MIIDNVILNKFKFLETIFFDKLQDKTNESLYEHKLKIKKIFSSSINQTLKQSSSDYPINQEIIDAINFENEREKIHFGSELHDGLEQVLASLSFYVEALQHSKKLNSKLKGQYLNKVRDLSQIALKTSNEVANNLMSNQFIEGNLLTALSSFFENIMAKNQLKIIQLVSDNFNEFSLNISKKQEVLKIIKTILYYFISTNYKGIITLKYSFKYNNVLQIDFIQNEILINTTLVEKFPMAGYNNIKHRLELLQAKIIQKGDYNFSIKTPITN